MIARGVRARNALRHVLVAGLGRFGAKPSTIRTWQTWMAARPAPSQRPYGRLQRQSYRAEAGSSDTPACN